LTRKQEAFVRAYSRCRNGAEAARQAGYSPHTARQSASKLLNERRYAHVQEALAEALADREAQDELAHELIRAALIQTITLNKRRLYQDGDLIPISEMDQEEAACIESVTISAYETEGSKTTQSGRSVTVRFSNRLRAIKLLGDASGLFKERARVDIHAEYERAEAELEDMLEQLSEAAEEAGDLACEMDRIEPDEEEGMAPES